MPYEVKERFVKISLFTVFFSGIYKTYSGLFFHPLIPIGVIFFEVWAAAKTMNNSIVFMATKGCGTKVDV